MKDTTLVRIFGIALGAVLCVFGAYVLYEKVFLAILDGHSFERAGIIYRAEEPFSFWLGIGTYGVCSLVVAVGGLALIVAVMKKPS